jgi:hypothetical protein
MVSLFLTPLNAKQRRLTRNWPRGQRHTESLSHPSRKRCEQRVEATRAADVTANNELLLHVCEVLYPCA